MSDWQIGDLGVCVDNAQRRRPSPRLAWLVVGQTYRVRTVGLPLGCIHVDGDGLGMNEGWRSDRFRKIRPDEHESCEPEFVTLLKRSKAPSPKERETRILEALFPESPTERAGRSNASRDTHGD